ncbi:MAG: polymer-forming cytoskeletal protein [Acidobacteriia bacterium]|nr:polymer-forming cytoskeletal protein [Terriglobia bacterium]
MSAAPTVRIEQPNGKAVIGPSVVIKGQIQSREDLTIEGQVEGTIEMSEHRLTIDANGRVQAGVNARVVEVQGSIQGQVEAVDKVYIRKGASFVGDIHSAGIVIEDGGYIKGNIDLTRPAAGNRGANAPAAVHAHAGLEVLAS